MCAIWRSGGVVAYKNAGGAGERRAVLHSLSDWGDGGGNRSAKLPRGSILIAKGIGLSRNEFSPGFGPMNKSARDLSPADASDIHLDNSSIHLYSDNSNPSFPKKNDWVAERALGFHTERMRMRRRKFESQVAHAKIPELAGLIQSMDGILTPEISKIAAAGRNIADRAPPYRPEVQRMEYIWSMTRGWCGARYEAVGDREYVRSFCEEPSELALSNIVGIFDKVTPIMAEDEAAFFLDDLAPGAISGESDSDDGAMPDK